jgi:hypothetical protein
VVDIGLGVRWIFRLVENSTEAMALVCLVPCETVNDYITGRQHRRGRNNRRSVILLPETWPIPSENHTGFYAGNVGLRSSNL